MWCKRCRQEVPGIATAAVGQLACARCGSPIVADPPGSFGAHTMGVAELSDHGVDLSEPADAPPELDLDSQLDHDIRQMRGVTPRGGHTAQAHARLDSVTPQQVAYWPAQSPSWPMRRRGPRSSKLAWTVLLLGFLVFAGGAGLLIWSLIDERDDLWSLGMPIAVAGQIGLLLGLVLQLERIWQGSRFAADKLEAVDRQLYALKQTTSMLGVNHGSAAQAFYAHMAEGASPQLLLADLKGQLDLLAMRMAQR